MSVNDVLQPCLDSGGESDELLALADNADAEETDNN